MAVLLEETRGFSDCEHLQQLEILKSVMFKTIKVKVGRGKKAKFIDEFAYDTDSDQEVRDNIIYSIKIYEKRCSDTDNINGK